MPQHHMKTNYVQYAILLDILTTFIIKSKSAHHAEWLDFYVLDVSCIILWDYATHDSKQIGTLTD